MGRKSAMEYCPDHGLVRAERRTVPLILWWVIVALSQGTFSPDHPYRCTKCGQLTEPNPPRQ